jgi:opacity protein-like surface antigen
MRALCAALAVLVASLAADLARADDDGFGRSGPYLGIGASRSVDLVEPFLSGTPILENLKISDSWGANARLGYRLTSWFSVEAEYEWLQPFNVSLNGVHLGTLGAQSATANVRFILPLSRFQPYLLLGAGAMFLKGDDPLNVLSVDHSPFAGRVGLGIDVYLTQSLLANVGVEGVLTPAGLQLNTGSTTISEHGLGTLTFQFGLGYRF